MKNTYISFVAFIILFCSCEKEYELIDVTKDFPETVQLIKSTLSGQVVNEHGDYVPQATIDIIVDNTTLGSQPVTDGFYEFANHPVHDARTIIRVSEEGYMPAYGHRGFVDGKTEKLDFQIVDDLYDREFNPTSAFTYETADGLQLELPPAAFSENEKPVEVSGRFIKVLGNRFLLNSNTGLVDGVEPANLHFNSIIMIAMSNEEGPIHQLSKQKEMKVSFSPTLSLRPEEILIWVFDQDSGKWMEGPKAQLIEDQYIFTATKVTYFAFVNECAGITGDETPPLAIARENFVLSLSKSNTIFPSDLDEQSFDFCDPELDFAILKETDVCLNTPGFPEPDFASLATFCQEEIGETIRVFMRVTDDDGNSSMVFSNVQVTE